MRRLDVLTLGTLACLVVCAVLLDRFSGADRTVAAAGPPPSAAHQASSTPRFPGGWEKGFVYTTWSPEQYASDAAARSLDQLAATGANAVSIITTLYQPTLHANAVAADPRMTPSDHSLAVAIARAMARGLKVRLRVMLDVSSGGLRSEIVPDDPMAWLTSYRESLLRYAAFAERLGVSTLEIGAELAGVSDRTEDWRKLVSAVRAVFHGRVTYGALCTEYQRIAWWDVLDEIGLDWYCPVSLGGWPTEDDVVAAWSHVEDANRAVHRYLDEIGAVAQRFGRPVTFTELGYPSSSNALVTPWQAGDVYDGGVQALALNAAFRALATQPWNHGVYLWQWSADPNVGGPGNTDHTVQGKPAEQTVSAWFTEPRAQGRVRTTTSLHPPRVRRVSYPRSDAAAPSRSAIVTVSGHKRPRAR